MSITNNTIVSNKIKEMVLAELRSVKAIQTDYAKVIDAMETHLEAYKKSKGTPAEKEHIQKLKTLTTQKKKLADELNAKVSDMYKDAELKVDEMNTTGGVEGYNTPFAFSGKDSEEKKGKRQADLTGYSVVKEGKYYVSYNRGRGQGKDLEKEFDPKTFKTTGKPMVFSSYSDAKKYAEKMEKMFRNSIGGSTAYWVSDEKMNRVEESVNESKLTVSQLPFKLLFNYPSGHTSTPGNFEDWYRDGMELKKGRIERFSPEDDKKLRSLINTWWDEVDDTSIEDFNFGRDNKYIKKVKKDILDFLIQKSKVIKESVNESDLKGYLVADVVDDIIKSIGSKFVSGQIKDGGNKNKVYLKLTDKKFGSGVVKILKSRFGIDSKYDTTFGNMPSVSFWGDKVVSESVNEDKVYIDFLNKKKGFKQDRIKFNSYEDAVKWARKNFEKFNPDMIKYESMNEAIQNAPAKNGKELADFILRHYDFYTDYIDDGGQRRRAIKSNEGTIEWFDSHPIDLKKEALKILQSKVGSSGKSQIQRVFGKSTMDK
jgi:hypothetical protein